MNVSQPFRFLCAKSSAPSIYLRRPFHTSNPLYAHRKPKFSSVKASDLKTTQIATADHFQRYSEAEKAALTRQYTPEQIAAIEAGEAAIDPNDLATQGTLREDSFALPYLDDLSYIHPIVDKPIRAPETNYDPNLRFKDEREIGDDLVEWVKNLPDNADRLDWLKFRDNLRLTVGKEEAELNPPSYLSPELPKIDGLVPPVSDNDEGTNKDPRLQRFIKQTGYSIKEIRRFRVKTLIYRRVVNQTRLGKIFSHYYLAVAGNGRGLIGIGEGKSAEIEDGRRMAELAAIRNLVPIPRYEARTIFGDVRGKVSGTELELMTRPPGKISLYCCASSKAKY